MEIISTIVLDNERGDIILKVMADMVFAVYAANIVD